MPHTTICSLLSENQWRPFHHNYLLSISTHLLESLFSSLLNWSSSRLLLPCYLVRTLMSVYSTQLIPFCPGNGPVFSMTASSFVPFCSPLLPFWLNVGADSFAVTSFTYLHLRASEYQLLTIHCSLLSACFFHLSPATLLLRACLPSLCSQNSPSLSRLYLLASCSFRTPILSCLSLHLLPPFSIADITMGNSTASPTTYHRNQHLRLRACPTYCLHFFHGNIDIFVPDADSSPMRILPLSSARILIFFFVPTRPFVILPRECRCLLLNATAPY